MRLSGRFLINHPGCVFFPTQKVYPLLQGLCFISFPCECSIVHVRPSYRPIIVLKSALSFGRECLFDLRMVLRMRTRTDALLGPSGTRA